MGVERGKRFYGVASKPDIAQQCASDRFHPARYPVQHQIEVMHQDLAAFNERIKELETEGHRGFAVEVLKRQALSMAGQIDELRCLLVVPRPRRQPRLELFPRVGRARQIPINRFTKHDRKRNQPPSGLGDAS
jgi:hypothetical protein